MASQVEGRQQLHSYLHSLIHRCGQYLCSDSRCSRYAHVGRLCLDPALLWYSSRLTRFLSSWSMSLRSLSPYVAAARTLSDPILTAVHRSSEVYQLLRWARLPGISLDDRPEQRFSRPTRCAPVAVWKPSFSTGEQLRFVSAPATDSICLQVYTALSDCGAGSTSTGPQKPNERCV